ncbi:hypothetical protein LCGC14_0826800 [marine sediment metagenome]|uniref:Uncharacterized protein n=1 Tax=marine sediment metagenome TaxID=412755 RepID=A0A0F9S1Z0_9ZZZZ
MLINFMTAITFLSIIYLVFRTGKGIFYLLSGKRKDKFAIEAEARNADGTIGWRVLINDKKSFYANFKTVPAGIPYHIEDWCQDDKKEG